MDKCPHCGSDTYYTKHYVSGTSHYYKRFDGEETDNTDMYGNLKHTLQSKYAWCADCEKRLFKVDEK